MIEKLNQKYIQIGLKKFLLQSALLAIICDILNICYIVLTFIPVYLTPSKLQHMVAAQTGGYILSRSEIREMQNVFTSTMSTILFAFMAIHIVIYFYLGRNKKWAKKYTTGYSLLAIIMTLMMIFPMIQIGHYVWSAIMLATTFAYFYIYMGLHLFKKNEAQ